MHVPQWNCWKWHCAPCNRRGITWDLPGAPCDFCGASTVLELEELRRAWRGRAACGCCSRTRHRQPRLRYPDGRTPWQVVPFAVETFGRLGLTALKHLRCLARTRAQGLSDGGEAAASSLTQRWAARLSTALHRSNALRLRSALGAAEPERQRARDLDAELAG